jgi:hypothetical protein
MRITVPSLQLSYRAHSAAAGTHLVCGIAIADNPVPPSEERHSDSDFVLVIFYDRSHEGNEVFGFLGVVLVEKFMAELTHQTSFVHKCVPPGTHIVFQG